MWFILGWLLGMSDREPPHTPHTCYCKCHESPDVARDAVRWAPRKDPVGTLTACTRCRHLHVPAAQPLALDPEPDGA